MTAIRDYAAAAQAHMMPSRLAWAMLETVEQQIEHLQLEIDKLQDRADQLVAQIEADDAGALCLLTIADCAALHMATEHVVAQSCVAARSAGYSDDEIADVLGIHRTTLSRRYPR